jgi:hypothetical protein
MLLCAIYPLSKPAMYWFLLSLYDLHLLTFPAFYSLSFSFSLSAIPPSLLPAHPLLLIPLAFLFLPLHLYSLSLFLPFSCRPPPPFLLPLCYPFSYLTSLFLLTLFTPSSSTSLPSLPFPYNSSLFSSSPSFTSCPSIHSSSILPLPAFFPASPPPSPSPSLLSPPPYFILHPPLIFLISIVLLSRHYPVICFPLKGTWQRGGFSGVFAEIGSA